MSDGDGDIGMAYHFCRGDVPQAAGAISSVAVAMQSALLLACAFKLFRSRKDVPGLALRYSPMEYAIIILQAVILPVGEVFFVWGDQVGVVSGGAMTTSAVTTWIVVNILIDLVLALGVILFQVQKTQNFRIIVASASPFRISVLIGIICDRAMNELLGIESLTATVLIVLSLMEIGFCYARYVEPDTDSLATKQHEIRQVVVTGGHADWYRDGYKTMIDEATPPSTPKGITGSAAMAVAKEVLDFAGDEKSHGFDEGVPDQAQQQLAATATMMARAQIARELNNLTNQTDPAAFVQTLLSLKAQESRRSVSSTSATTSAGGAETNSSVRQRRKQRSRDTSESDGGSSMVMATVHIAGPKKDDAEVSGY